MLINRKEMVFVLFVMLMGCAGSMPTATLYQTPQSEHDIYVDVYDAGKAYNGTTLLSDNHVKDRPRIIEVDMNGKIVWEYVLPPYLREYNNPGFDVERLANGNILFVLPLKGVYEIDRNGHVIWSYMDSQVTHDADRLPNGNTLVVFGGSDSKDDMQAKEINPKGEIVWCWRAKDHLDTAEYGNIYDQGWTHANAVTRLENGNTLISLRNFNIVVEVAPNGSIVRTIGKGIFHYQHDPEVLPNNNLLVMNHVRPNRAIEINPKTNQVVWASRHFKRNMSPVRDADRLPNGNILITGTTRLLEFTPDGELVWRLNLNVRFENRRQAPARGFYKAERK
ncbi:MAG: aryl-sulfate sulfotransferase [Deltaproteobacteria bacterium]|nr:aryl-sulfate sulfotransferase [Deltaproteobacteria bacterium]